MASFNAAYGLCSVIDSGSLLGLSDDEDGCAVITIGKNMVIRCRISDQKQLNSWSTKLSKLTSHVVYNSITKSYVGVFDDRYIKQWTKEDSSIERLKKHTLKSEIHEIILNKDIGPSGPTLFLLFKNGACLKLESALSSKPEISGILQPNEVIQSGTIITAEEKFLVIVVKVQNKYHLCYCVQLEQEKYCIISNTVKKIKLRRHGALMLGHCILQEDKGNFLLTYWSDGFLYSLPLPLTEEKNDVGKFLGPIHTVSSKFEVAMIPVSLNQIAFYASDISQEGAFLGIYNVKFGLFQANTNFKLFNKPPRMWVVENNIVIMMGQRLVCVPFTLQAEALATVACSRALHNKPPSLSDEISAVVPTLTWESSDRELVKTEWTCPANMKELLSACSSQGWSEYGISQFVLNRLIETKDFESIHWCLQTFIDIPEEFIVKLLVLVLNERNSDISCEDENKSGDEDSKSLFLNKILRIPVIDVNVLNGLRQYFNFEDALSLLKHLRNVEPLEDAKSYENILLWTMVLLDAFYQQFILTRDTKVLEIICSVKQHIESEIATVNEFKKLLPLLTRFRSGKEVLKNQYKNSTYWIEKFRLYE